MRRHSEPVRFAQGKLREESALVRLGPELQILRFAQDDSDFRLRGCAAGTRPLRITALSLVHGLHGRNRRLPSMLVSEGKAPKKTSGMHCCIPESSFRILLRTYLFFFAFFFAAILFSSKLFEIHASVAGGARIQSHV